MGFRVDSVYRSIGDFIGTFIQSDPTDIATSGRNFLRIKVALYVQKPIKRRMKIRRSGGDWLWIHFKYERLPNFCFFCGIIGHSDKFCDKLFDRSSFSAERPYGSHLRAQIGRQQLHLGAPWLRNPSFLGQTSGGSGLGASMEIDPIMVVNDSNTRNYQVNQQSQGNSHFSSDKVTAAIFGDNQHAHLSITDGGIVVDPKRQRVQEKGTVN